MGKPTFHDRPARSRGAVAYHGVCGSAGRALEHSAAHSVERLDRYTFEASLCCTEGLNRQAIQPIEKHFTHGKEKTLTLTLREAECLADVAGKATSTTSVMASLVATGSTIEGGSTFATITTGIADDRSTRARSPLVSIVEGFPDQSIMVKFQQRYQMRHRNSPSEDLCRGVASSVYEPVGSTPFSASFAFRRDDRSESY